MVVDAPAFGWKIRIGVRDSYAGKTIFREGDWEKENTEFLLKNLPLDDGDVAVDVGANIGWYSLLLDKIAANSGARVIGFEPEPENFRLLTDNLRRNNAKSVTAVHKGLSDQSASKTVNLHADSGGHSMLPLAANPRSVAVKTVTLNDFLRQEKINPRRVRFMKMDVEGFEWIALRGAGDVLQTCPLLMIEYAPRLMAQGNLQPQDLLDLMHKNGYRAHYLIRGHLHEANQASLLDDENPVDLFWRKQ